MACNCTTSCNCDDLVALVGPKGYDGPDTIGPDGNPGNPGNVGLIGPKGPDGSDSTFYDSGWTTLNTYNGTFGLPIINGAPELCIRVVGKNVTIAGTFTIPLSSDGGATLYNNYPIYGVDNAGANFIQVYTGSNGGFEIVSPTFMVSNTSIIPEDLCPSKEHIIEHQPNIDRGINPQGLPGKGITMSAVLGNFSLDVEGKLVVRTITHDEYGSTLVPNVSNTLFHHLISNHSLNSVVGSYDNIEDGGTHIWDTSHPENLTINPATEIYLTSPYKYPNTFNGTVVNNLGGFEINFNFTYPVNETKTEEQIIAAFNSI